jgi:hypothetical protein
VYRFFKFNNYSLKSNDQVWLINELKKISEYDIAVFNVGEENVSDIDVYKSISFLVGELNDLSVSYIFLFNQTFDEVELKKILPKNTFFIFNTDLYNSFLPIDMGYQNNQTSYYFSENNSLLQIGHFNQTNRLSLLLLLKKIIPNQLLYGFYPNRYWDENDIDDYYKQLINFGITQNQKEYIFELENKLDLIERFDNTGYPFKIWPYQKSSISIISETNEPTENNYDSHFLNVTEKTYRTIINHQPFLFFGGYGQLDILEREGFNTFKRLFPIQDYNDYEFIFNFQNEGKIIDYYKEVINQNLIYFLQKIQNEEFFELIKDTTKSNFKLLEDKFFEIENSVTLFKDEQFKFKYFKNAYNFEEAYINFSG